MNPETSPIRIGPSVVVGRTEAETRPFEPAGVDYAAEYAKHNHDPTAGCHRVPDAVVNSCSECCMESINGKPNILGRMHRKMVNGCSQCPVGQSSEYIQARDGSGNLLWKRMPDGTRRPVTKAEIMIMETDGTA